MRSKSKSSVGYMYVDDNDCDLIYYRYGTGRNSTSSTTITTSDEQCLGESNDLLLEYKTNRVLSRQSNRVCISSIVCLVLGFCLLSVVTVFGNKYLFRLNLSELCNRFALTADNSEDSNALLSLFETAVTVQTDCMKIIGNVEENAITFKGIPYAIPPVGALRWSRPIALYRSENQCNNENVLKANRFSSDCLQYNPSVNQIVGEENCLYLNVWTPRLDDSANLNVLVYIHGGLDSGSANGPVRPTGWLASRLNVVFVSIHYRLNAFGFLALDLLSNSNANSSHANYGLWDVTVALQWVRRNIRAFGGHPYRLTMFGADGQLIGSLLANNQYSALINSAFILNRRLDSVDKQSFELQSNLFRNSFLIRTNCSTVDCLQAINAPNVLKTYHQIRQQINYSLIVCDEEIVSSVPNEDISKALVLISNENCKLDCHSLNHLSNISSKMYLYCVQPNASIDQNSTNSQLDSNQLLLFLTAIDQSVDSIAHNRTSIADELQKFVLNFINQRYSSQQTINSSVIYSVKC